MIKVSENREWNIYNGVLTLKTNETLVTPSAEQIYSAIFENNESDIFTKTEIGLLASKVHFSKYPVYLKIILKSLDSNGFSILLKILAFSETGESIEVSSSGNADHVIINNIWYPFSNGEMEEIMEILTSSGISHEGQINLRQYLLLTKVASGLIVNDVHDLNLNLTAKYSDTQPVNLNAQLYPYQLKGWRWLQFMRQEKIGGILADEMGLGKTIQVIALLCSERKEDVFPSLIISPTTLLENWRRELTKFSPHITAHIHQGPQRTGFPNEMKKFDTIITSYDTVIRDSSLFNQIDWKLVICDEAQSIKNPETKRAKSIKRISRQVAFAVTGTPIENRLSDLWSIMDFAVPGFLGNQIDFENTYENEQGGASKLEKIISPLILRRMVTEVAKDLPTKLIIPQVIELSEEEVNQYETIRDNTLQEFKSNTSLVVLSRLRMFCAHPFLIENKPNENPVFYSNKYTRLVEIAEEIISNNAKMLVFTSYNKMNDIISADLKSRFNIYSNSIDGRTEVKHRQTIVDEFSNVKGPAVLVLNPIAAGTGLNITAANHVIHYNLEWNPAKEDQASARAYRRGQDRPVTIHRLFYANTVEEAIDERLNRKRELAGTAIIGVQGEENDLEDILYALQKSPKINDPSRKN